jgi:hypothetical protein
MESSSMSAGFSLNIFYNFAPPEKSDKCHQASGHLKLAGRQAKKRGDPEIAGSNYRL